MIDRAYLEAAYTAREIEQLAGGPAGEAEADEAVAAAIARATAEVESRLASRYQTPVANPPDELRELCATLARARLYPASRPEYIDERAAEARKYLDDAGQARREIQGLTPRERTGRFAGTRRRRDRTFTRETLSGY
ncbi:MULTISPECIES: phage protein Gp36 family protein [unclassified Thioalkalivibrio]|uniref:phage protein Gp36 family protein n=1 Tax=unclassified Thioalkalivibrio TaxID=2621013 RepID=UPI0003744B29|nr:MULTISPECIES: phage protein Gp36 family protein [unclassified Thioalkalivibrio]